MRTRVRVRPKPKTPALRARDRIRDVLREDRGKQSADRMDSFLHTRGYQLLWAYADKKDRSGVWLAHAKLWLEEQGE